MRLGKREIILLIILAAVIAGYLAYTIGYEPLARMISEQQTILQASKVVYNDALSKSAEDESLRAELGKIEKEINSYERKIFYSKDMPGTFVDMYYLIQENKLSGDSISFGAVTEGQEYNSFNISFSVDGRKNNIYNFIKCLQNYKKEISISNISFQPSGSDEMKLIVTLKLYILKNVPGKDPEDYDFMNEKNGSFRHLLDMFKNVSLPDGK